MKKLGRPDLVAHADYVALLDTDAACSAVTVWNDVFLALRTENRERWSFIRMNAMDAACAFRPVGQMQSKWCSGQASDLCLQPLKPKNFAIVLLQVSFLKSQDLPYMS